MNDEKTPSNFSKIRVFSNCVLIFLLTVRIVDQYLSDIIFGADAPNWFNDYYSFSIYVLIFLLVWLNKDDLKSYNIDAASFNILLFGGATLILQLSEELLKIILLITLLFFYWTKSKNLLYTYEGNKYSFYFPVILIFFIGLAWLPVLFYSAQPRASIQNIDLLAAFFQASPAGVIFEEFLFRGFLWGQFRKIKLDERVILLIQAVLFWASHHKFLLLHNPYFFWVPLPIMALLLGWLVLKSKSLTYSTAAHFLFNFTTSIIKQIYF